MLANSHHVIKIMLSRIGTRHECYSEIGIQKQLLHSIASLMYSIWYQNRPMRKREYMLNSHISSTYYRFGELVIVKVSKPQDLEFISLRYPIIIIEMSIARKKNNFFLCGSLTLETRAFGQTHTHINTNYKGEYASFHPFHPDIYDHRSLILCEDVICDVKRLVDVQMHSLNKWHSSWVGTI